MRTLPTSNSSDVSKAFGRREVLNDVSFEVLPGEMVCILGRSGVGKSVSLHNIMGFLKPDSGRVIVAGQDITDYTEAQLEDIRKKVTMVFQNGALFDSLSVGENVAFPLREKGELSKIRSSRSSMACSKWSASRKCATAPLRPLHRHEALRRHRPRARRPTRVRPLRRAHHHGRSADGQSPRRSDRPPKLQLHLTSVVVTHDMRLAKKLADRVVFLHEAQAIFFGTYKEMENSHHPIIQEFLELDELKLEA